MLASLAATERFSVTDLERFGDCSSIWFVERMLRPGEIDFELDAKLRGSVAHATLARFFAQLPAELGMERLTPENVEDAWPVMLRCLHDALGGQRVGDTVGGRELARSLERDLEAFLRTEATLNMEFVPRRFEVRFGGASSPPGLKEGLKIGDFAVTGTIDRIDMDPGMSPRGVLWDYKSGATVHPAAQLARQGKLQLPLYIMALRDLLGIEPIGGLYRALAGKRDARGMVLDAEIGDGAPQQERPARLPRRSGSTSRTRRRWPSRWCGGCARGRRAARSARRPLPVVVHLLHGLPGGEAVSRDWNPEQAEPSRATATCSSPPVPARARPRCWWSACCAASTPARRSMRSS